MITSHRVGIATQDRPAFPFRVPSPWFVLTLLVGILVLLRLPSILFPREVSVDESQMLSQGMKFLVDPRPWIAGDGATIGPLNSYFLSVFLLIFHPGYVMLHAVATLLVGLQLLLAYQTLRLVVPEKMAALGSLLVGLVYSVGGSDYGHYSSELLPATLLGFGFFSLVVKLKRLFDKRRFQGPILMFLAGLSIGSAPWAKSQAAPVAGALGLVLLAAIVFHRRRVSLPAPSVSRALKAAALCLGAILPTAIILTIVVTIGAVNDFWCSYILNTLAYAGPLSWSTMVRHGFGLLLFTPLNQLLMFSLVGTSLLALRTPNNWSWAPRSKDHWVFTGLLTYVGAAFLAASRPHYSFRHHGVFLVLPLTYLAVLLLSHSLDSLIGAQGPLAKWRKGLVVAVLGANIALYAAWGFHQVHWIVSRPTWDSNEKIAAVIHDVQQTRSVRSLAIWGWMPGVYVLTRMPPATRDSIAQFIILQGPFQYYFRTRFLGDLRKNPPDLFLDAAVPGTFGEWTGNDGYESDPELRKFVNENYSLAAELSLVPNARPVRFFVRNAKAPA